MICLPRPVQLQAAKYNLLFSGFKTNPETLKPEHPEYTPGSVSLRHRMIGLGIRFLEGNAEITM
jgi:hypothetical protein